MYNTIELFVNEENNERIDVYLTKELEELSRTCIQGLIKDKFITVNGSYIKPRYIVRKGDRIVVKLPKFKDIEVKPENIPIDILYEDSDIAIINKPQGMVVHPAPGNYSGTLVNALLYHMDSLSNINGIMRPGIVHRLDKDTSGVLIIAKNNYSHIKLADDLKKHEVKREYITLVYGVLDKDKGVINAPIGRNPIDRKKMTVIYENSKEAITHYRVIERYKGYSLVEATLETGRTHQIRVHMAYINHPVVGDHVYSNRKCEFNVNKQLLHAKIVGFNHPRTGEYMEFQAPLPDCFCKIIKKLRNGY